MDPIDRSDLFAVHAALGSLLRQIAALAPDPAAVTAAFAQDMAAEAEFWNGLISDPRPALALSAIEIAGKVEDLAQAVSDAAERAHCATIARAAGRP